MLVNTGRDEMGSGVKFLAVSRDKWNRMVVNHRITKVGKDL